MLISGNSIIVPKLNNVGRKKVVYKYLWADEKQKIMRIFQQIHLISSFMEEGP